jgi:thioredoxin 1
MDEMDQYYKILELKPGASEEEIKQAYKDLVNIWHPDQVSSNPHLVERANEKLKEINLAYEKLMEYITGSPKETSSVDREDRTGLESQGHNDEPPSPPRSEPSTETTSDQAPYEAPKRKKVKNSFIFGAIVILLIAGASVSYFFYFGNPGRKALAQVNDEKITVEQLNKELAKVEEPMRAMYKEEPGKFLDIIIVKALLLQEAKKQGVSLPAKTYKDTEKESQSPEEALITELMKKKFSSPPQITREEIETFYKMFKDRMEGKPLNQVAPMIEQIIQEAKQQEALGQFLGDLRKNAKVEINQDRLQKITVKPPESNTEDELKKALTSGKPILVDFGANSCIPCRQMRPVLKEISAEYSEKAKILVIDVYQYQNLAREYKVMLIPTLVFFDPKGKEVFRHVGVLEKEKIVAKIKEIGMGT